MLGGGCELLDLLARRLNSMSLIPSMNSPSFIMEIKCLHLGTLTVVPNTTQP